MSIIESSRYAWAIMSQHDTVKARRGTRVVLTIPVMTAEMEAAAYRAGLRSTDS